MDKLKEVLKSKQAKRFYWNTVNGIIGLVIVFVASLDYYMIPVIIAALNGASKEIDNKVKNLKHKS